MSVAPATSRDARKPHFASGRKWLNVDFRPRGSTIEVLLSAINAAQVYDVAIASEMQVTSYKCTSSGGDKFTPLVKLQNIRVGKFLILLIAAHPPRDHTHDGLVCGRKTNKTLKIIPR